MWIRKRDAMQKNDQLADLTEVYANCASDRIKDIYASYGEEILQGCTPLTES